MGVEESFKLANARVRGPASFLPNANDVKARVGSARVDAAKRHRRFITDINHRRYLLTWSLLTYSLKCKRLRELRAY